MDEINNNKEKIINILNEWEKHCEFMSGDVKTKWLNNIQIIKKYIKQTTK